MGDKLELLSEELIDAHPALAMDVLGASSRLAIPLGWHYLLDLTWILREIGQRENQTILEVGAGLGLLQFILADRGHRVISADMRVRKPPARLAALYHFDSLGTTDAIEHAYLEHHGLEKKPGGIGKLMDTKIGELPSKILGIARPRSGTKTRAASPSVPTPERPRISLYRCDATSMKELADHSVDVVISVSALEHNEPAQIRRIAREAERIVRPGGLLLHTMSACREGQQFHEPSHSHLLDATHLADIFSLSNPDSNFAQFAVFETRLRQATHLPRWLAHSYYEGGNNGMPWGIWNPAYVPVGVGREIGGGNR